MEYRNFGTGGVKVSPIALGLGFRGQADPAAAERTIRAAIENGINLIDCANVYGLTDSREFAGTSEQVLSKVLKDHRDDLVVTSKVFSPIGPGPNDTGLSRFHIMREIERTLRRLDTDHIDVYLVHGYDDVVALEEQFRALDDLVTQGKTRYIGVCNYQAWQVIQAVGIQDQIGADRLITVQNPYSLLNRALEYEMFPMLANTSIGAMAYSPLAVGLLSGAYVPEEIPPDHTLWGSIRRDWYPEVLQGRAADVLSAVNAVANERSLTMPQVAFAWVLSHPEVTVAISGADTESQIEDVAQAADVILSYEEIGMLNDASSGLGIVLDRG
jgi:aryl-alcohol dehydrogenase-like predicted oxidoreductase